MTSPPSRSQATPYLSNMTVALNSKGRLSHVPTQAQVDAAKTQSVIAICADTSSRRLFLSIDKATYQFVNDSGQLFKSYNMRDSDCT
jgi:hypothetical protein